MPLPDISPEALEMLTRYANRPDLDFEKGDIKGALESIIKSTTQAYKTVAKEWHDAKKKRLAKEDENFRKTHSGFKRHKDFGY